MGRMAAIVGIIIWMASVTGWFVYQLLLFPDACIGDEETIYLCKLLNSTFFCLYALGLWLLGVAAYSLRTILRPLIIGGTSGWFAISLHSYVALELQDVRTYSYEVFIVSFYAWIAAMVFGILTALLLPQWQKWVQRAVAIVTIPLLFLFALEGRGSVEHITPLIGGVLAEWSLDSALLGKIIWMVSFFFTGTLVYLIVFSLVDWIRSGKLAGREPIRAGKICGFFILVLLSSLLTIPVGVVLNNRDVGAAKAYINQLIEPLQAYKEMEGEFPRALTQVEKLPEPKPRLIRNFEYLAYDTEGAYYFSHPEKYCLIFQDPGKDYGYYSLTSDRGWQNSHKGHDLAEAYLSICGEGGLMSEEGLVAGTLGLPDPNDPLGEIGLELDQVVRPANTAATTGALEQALDTLAEENPGVYGPVVPQPPLPNSRQGLRELLHYETERLEAEQEK